MRHGVDLGKRREREVWLRRHMKSGLTVAAFCEWEGVSTAAFYNWRKKLIADFVNRPLTGSTRFTPAGREPDSRWIARHFCWFV